MCSASRAVIYTGLHMPHNGIFDNAGVPYMKSLDPKLPTIGKILRKLGYYTAYKGKLHLNGAMAVENQPSDIKALFESVMDKDYGFYDYTGTGDYIEGALGGYQYDQITSAQAGAVAEGQGPADDRPPAALVPRRQSRQSARRDVAQHRSSRPARPGQGRPAQDRLRARGHALHSRNGTTFRCRTPGSSRSTRRAAWPPIASITRPTAI